MKKITFLFLLFTTVSFSQVSTTIDEYNYLVKGYKIALESGLDMKKGYGFREVSSYNEKNYSFSFYQFVRTGTNEVCATMVSATSKLWGNQYYLCIPLNNSDLYSAYIQNLKLWDKEILVAYSTALSSYLNLYNDSQNDKKLSLIK